MQLHHLRIGQDVFAKSGAKKEIAFLQFFGVQNFDICMILVCACPSTANFVCLYGWLKYVSPYSQISYVCFAATFGKVSGAF